MSAPRVGRAEVATVYVVGLFQGLALVAFPAASSVRAERAVART